MRSHAPEAQGGGLQFVPESDADINVHTLAPDQGRSVYPLIRQVVATRDLAGWPRFARALIHARRPGLGGIRRQPSAAAIPCGLFCYRQEQRLTRGKVLVAAHFVALDPLEPELVLAAPVNELDALAECFGSTAVRSVVH